MSFKRVINVVETHDGEPMRVVTGGVGHIPGNSVYEMEEYLRLYNDGLRKFLLREPRGYPPMCCNIIVPPKHPDAAAGFIIFTYIFNLQDIVIILHTFLYYTHCPNCLSFICPTEHGFSDR